MTALDEIDALVVAAYEACNYCRRNPDKPGRWNRCEYHEGYDDGIDMAVASGHLIAADDRDGLLAALEAEQVGSYNVDNKLHEQMSTCERFDCVPVYTIDPKEPQ